MISTQPVTVPGAQLPASTSPASGQTLGKDDFLKLLITQLQHQDPLNPLDQNQFLSQTAQFSSLEQLQNINDSLTKMASTTSASSAAQAAGLLGKTVKVSGQSFALAAGGTVALPFTLEGAPSAVHIEIRDDQNNVVRTLDVNPTTTGSMTATWDGLDSSGNQMEAGQYTYHVTAANASSVASALKGTLSGFEINGGTLRYRLGNALISADDIIDVSL